MPQSETLEWHEPTLAEIAAWDWDRPIIGKPLPGDLWDELPKAKQEELVERWKKGLSLDVTTYRNARDLYTLARAIEFERRVDIYLANAEAALDSIEINRGQYRKLVEERDKALGLHEQAWNRVNALVAKVLGKEVGNGIDVG